MNRRCIPRVIFALALLVALTAALPGDALATELVGPRGERTELAASGGPLAVLGAGIRPSLVGFGIAGSVTSATSGRVISGATVSLYEFHPGTSSWDTIRSTTSGPSGAYSFAGVATATQVRLVASKSGLANATWPTGSTVFVGHDVTASVGATRTCNIVMSPEAILVLHPVTEATGGPAPSAYPSGNQIAENVVFTLSPSPSGASTYAGNPPGAYRLGVAPLGGFLSHWTPTSQGLTDRSIVAGTNHITVKARHDADTYRDVVRISGTDRYTTAVQAAVEADTRNVFADHQGMRTVSNVIIASGEDAGMVDALSAAGLAGVRANKTPLLLVRRTSVPADVVASLREIQTPYTFTIVGGTGAVSDSVKSQIDALPNATFDRRLAGTNRYATSAAVAEEMRRLRGSALGIGLVANGSDAANAWDALALSPIAAADGYPILLVPGDSVPASISAAISSTGISATRIAGGTGVVSAAVESSLPAPTRWAGANRYATARVIADAACGAGLLQARNFGLAGGIIDALSGGAMMGSKTGPLLISKPTSLGPEAASFIQARRSTLLLGFVFGGSSLVPTSTSYSAMSLINSAPPVP
jgi:putative cell wall-binding protein